MNIFQILNLGLYCVFSGVSWLGFMVLCSSNTQTLVGCQFLGCCGDLLLELFFSVIPISYFINYYNYIANIFSLVFHFQRSILFYSFILSEYFTHFFLDLTLNFFFFFFYYYSSLCLLLLLLSFDAIVLLLRLPLLLVKIL